MLRTVLIDDEPGARAELRWLLAAHPGYTIVGEAATFTSARELLTSLPYDLVLLDIQLIGGTGLDLVPFIAPTARVIFITAYDQHAVRAFEINALDYLLKPVSTARFAAALGRLSLPAPPAVDLPPGSEPFLPSPPTVTTRPASPAPAPSARALALRLEDQILLKLDSAHARFVRLAEIRSISAAENYTEVVLGTGEKLFVRRTMKSWEELLPDAAFGRVHRTVIIALAHIEKIVRLNRTAFAVHLRGQRDPLPVSYRLVPDLRARLGTLWPEL
jgi:two-component system LytT family response regulator